MKYFIVALEMLAVLLSGTTVVCEAKSPAGELPTSSSASATVQRLPYVYTEWKHFTVKDGLPNDHVFAIKADGAKAWIGTENGLACIDKKTGKIKSWKEEDGLPWRVVSSLDINPKTGELWVGLFGGGLARFSGGRFDHWHQLNSGLVNDVVYGVAI
jgi:ligand-binding sensor domain-containing protein